MPSVHFWDRRHFWRHSLFLSHGLSEVKAFINAIDLYCQDCMRFLISGIRTKSRYNVSYEFLKRLGYRSLVHEYYSFVQTACIFSCIWCRDWCNENDARLSNGFAEHPLFWILLFNQIRSCRTIFYICRYCFPDTVNGIPIFPIDCPYTIKSHQPASRKSLILRIIVFRIWSFAGLFSLNSV